MTGSMAGKLRERWPYGALLLAVVTLDRLTKLLVDRYMEVHDSHPVIGGILSLSYVRNRGAAFGILSDADLPYQSVLFAIVGALALGAILVYSAKLPASSRLPQTALTLVMGGAVGNLLDRATLGYVIDFVDVFWGRHHWPAFNVADSAISVGVCLLVLDMLRRPEDSRGPEDSDVAEATSAGRSD